MTKQALNFVCGIFAAFIGVLFGEVTGALICLFILMFCDVITGVLACVFFHKTKYGNGFSSDGLYQGIIRKGLEMVVIVVATQLDSILEINYLRAGVVMYLCVTEAISIIENAARCGVPILPQLAKILDVTKNHLEEKE